ncbi:VOC family protein [Microbacterium marinum]
MPHMASIYSIVWGVRDITRAVEFWTAALDYVPKREPGDDWASLVPREGTGVQLSLMLVGSDKPQRHHLDILAEDRTAEVERLVALGATTVDDWDYEDGADYIVLRDPDGNTFCVVSD